MKYLVIVMMLFPIVAKTQQPANGGNQQTASLESRPTQAGIKWTEGLSWEQVKAKAKAENKYIFLDAFATWCVPCKLMDKTVYQTDTVGNYFNKRFIAVKVQMDLTKNDNDQVKDWYYDAMALQKKYRVVAYPSLLYFSPEGVIVHKETGFIQINRLLESANRAVTPGLVYNDPYEEYDGLLADYRQGKKNYDRMVYMSKSASQLGEVDLAKLLLNEHTDYVEGLKPAERYSKENIEFWSSFLLNSNGKRFKFFYEDGDFIDKVMNKKGYAASIVDRTIFSEVVDTFFKEQTANSGKMAPGMVLTDLREKPKTDYREADWKKLYQAIRSKFNKSYAKRNVLEARLLWYQRHNNYDAYVKCQLEKFDKYPPDISNETVAPMINVFGWTAFLQITDKALLESARKWVEKALSQWPNEVDMLDTYANLLYKLGNKKEAIEFEEKAVMAAEKSPYYKRKIPGFKAVIEKMKKGEPTYLEQGAVWAKN